jgi:HEAT repeat protein
MKIRNSRACLVSLLLPIVTLTVLLQLELVTRPRPGHAAASTDPGVARRSPPTAPDDDRAPNATGARSESKCPRLVGAGTRLVFEWLAELGFTPDVQQDARGSAFVHTGELVFDLIRRDESSVTLAATVEGLVIDAGDTEVEEDAPSLRLNRTTLAARILVSVSPTGQILGYRFPPEFTGVQRNLWRTVIGAVALAIPADPPVAWESREADGSGPYQARYERVSDTGGLLRVRRSKLGYAELCGNYDALAGHRVEGGAEGVFDRSLGWLREVQVDEALLFASPLHGAQARASFRGRLSLRKVLPAPAGDLDITGLLAQDLQAASGAAEDVTAPPEERLAMLRRALGGVSFEATVDDLVHLVAGGPYGSEELQHAWLQLVHLLEVNPSMAVRVRDLVFASSAGEDVACLLASALAGAGNAACQIALGDIHGDGALPEKVREAAVIAMCQIREPHPELVRPLIQHLESDEWAEPLALTSMLALGALASRTRSSLDGRSAFDALISLEEKARRLGATDTWLQALGNVESAEVVSRVLPYLRDDRMHVRLSAVTALRARASDDGVVLQVRERALSDSSDPVRAEAVAVLARSRSEEAFAAVRRALGDASEAVRRQAVVGLAQRRDRDEERASLLAVARNDPSEALRELARSVLAQ